MASTNLEFPWKGLVIAVVREQELPYKISPEIVTEFLARTLASIPRSDQRRWGDLYVRGLLSVEGKKTMRALASNADGSTEQSLYQFISKSPWDALPVRQELARLFQRHTQPRAWVVQPLVITKVGRHSVGVERQFVSQFGRVVNCQQAMGVWLASDQMSCPVDWRLVLPECWTDEPGMRERASIPDNVGACPPEKCAIDSITEMSNEWSLHSRPVVMDLRETDPYPVCRELAERRIPFVVRVSPVTPYTSLDPRQSRPGQGGAHSELIGALSRHQMPVEWLDHATDTLRATSVGATRVRLVNRQAAANRQEFMLLGAWSTPGQPRPDEFWLSNFPQSQIGTAYRTAMLSRRVERDLAEVSDPLGVRDFEGRSFRGWHHHMTMVSLAHAITMLATPQSARSLSDPRMVGASAA
ncbi:transposase [Streptomyces sp. ISL-86]|uniref:IS701 family transposase n=1 Tax=Streptomyces sp. ISL-86 TaxID=2819187 RepID=UPI001BE79150|nr:transposase [Streptomyces sp. ISL-86]MBT2454436.1 transposase [Streptomyces sp. ISL-86]